MPVRIALGNSLNIPAVKTLEFVGVDAAVDMARKMGITTWTDTQPLGLVDGARRRRGPPARHDRRRTPSWRTTAVRIPLVAITKIVDADGNIVEEYKVPQGEQVVDPALAYMVTNILSDNNARLITYGPNSMLKLLAPGRGQDGHHRQLPRHLDDGLHAEPGDRRLGRQHRRPPDEGGAELDERGQDLARGDGHRDRLPPAARQEFSRPAAWSTSRSAATRDASGRPRLLSRPVPDRACPSG